MQYLPRRQPFFVPFEHWTSWEPDDRITFLAAHLNDSPGNLCPWWDWSKFAVRQLQWDTYFKPIWSNIFYFNVYGQMKKSITRSCLNSLSLKERWCTRETIHNIDKRQNIDRATRKRGRERQERLCLPNSTSDVFWILLSWDLHLSIHSICFSSSKQRLSYSFLPSVVLLLLNKNIQPPRNIQLLAISEKFLTFWSTERF